MLRRHDVARGGGLGVGNRGRACRNGGRADCCAGRRGFGGGVAKGAADIGVYARVAAAKGAARERPRPLYLREPDAKPQAGFVLPRREA